MGGEPERAHRLHHQHREIAAAAAAEPQGPDRILDAAFLTRDICQVLRESRGSSPPAVRRFAAAVWRKNCRAHRSTSCSGSRYCRSIDRNRSGISSAP